MYFSRGEGGVTFLVCLSLLPRGITHSTLLGMRGELIDPRGLALYCVLYTRGGESSTREDTN